MISKHHLKPRRTFHFTPALVFYTARRQQRTEIMLFLPLRRSRRPVWKITFFVLLSVCQATHVYTVKSNRIYIIIFVDNGETTTWKNDIFSIEINIQYWFSVERHERLDIYYDSCLVATAEHFDGVFAFFLPAPHTHRNPIIPKQIFFV